MEELLRFTVLRPPVRASNLVPLAATGTAQAVAEAIDSNDSAALARALDAHRASGRDLDADRATHATKLAGAPTRGDDFDGFVRERFGGAVTALLESTAFQAEWAAVSDSILAGFYGDGRADALDALCVAARRLYLVHARARGDADLGWVLGAALGTSVRSGLGREAALLPEPQPRPRESAQAVGDTTRKLGEARQLLQTLRSQARAAPVEVRLSPITTVVAAASSSLQTFLGRRSTQPKASLLDVVTSLVRPATARPSHVLDAEHVARLARLGVDADANSHDLATHALQQLIGGLESDLRKLQAEQGVADLPQVVVHQGVALVVGGAKPKTALDTHGFVRSPRVAELKVVRQQTRRYDGGDLAHIENVMLGESKKRRHERTTELTTERSDESESSREVEKDERTHTQDELKAEVSNAVKDSEHFKAGATVSGSYGPTISFNASMEYTKDSTREQSQRQAENHVKELTQQAKEKVNERSRTLERRLSVERITERNTHGYENDDGTDHVVGMYQWVNRIVEAQVVNLGKRVMLELVLPEPARAWGQLIAEGKGAGDTELTEVVPTKPTPPTLADLDALHDETTFHTLVARYGVTGVAPAPSAWLVVTASRERDAADKGKNFTMQLDLELPEGYQPVELTLGLRDSQYSEGDGQMYTGTHAVLVSQLSASMSNTEVAPRSVWEWSHAHPAHPNAYGPGLADALPYQKFTGFGQGQADWSKVSVGLSMRGDGAVAVAHLRCTLTTRGLERWRMDTWAAVQRAYEQKVEAYNRWVARRQSEALIAPYGYSPGQCREIERNELKRMCIELLSSRPTAASVNGYTTPFSVSARGRWVSFFEESFEWENLTYTFYPYFWAERTRWPQLLQQATTDGQFQQFLQAGSALVRLAIRPGSERHVLHFLETAKIATSETPPVGSQASLAMLAELEGQTTAPPEALEGQPWFLTVATPLVRLRALGSGLPEWTRDPVDNQWRETKPF